MIISSLIGWFFIQELDCFEAYPIEIIPGFLYSGTVKQSQSPNINKVLKVKAHVNVTTSEDTLWVEYGSYFIVHVLYIYAYK